MEKSNQNKLVDLILNEGIITKEASSVANTTREDIAKIKAELELKSLAKEEKLRSNFKQKELDLQRRHDELKIALAEKERALLNSLSEKDVEFQRDRAKLQSQFYERESSLRQEIALQHAALKEREATFRSQSDALIQRTKLLEDEHMALQQEIRQRASDHENAIADLVRQKEQFQADFQARMESKATEYVDSALASLKASEERFDKIGYAWSLAGLATVLIGLFLGYHLALEGTKEVVLNKDISWSLMLFFGVKGAVLLGLIFTVVRLCLNLARSYMHESLKNAERRHAINYGKFYLSVYGAGTDGEKVKDVFAHWNITGSSAFSETRDISPSQTPNLEVGEFVKTMVSTLQKAAESGTK